MSRSRRSTRGIVPGTRCRVFWIADARAVARRETRGADGAQRGRAGRGTKKRSGRTSRVFSFRALTGARFKISTFYRSERAKLPSGPRRVDASSSSSSSRTSERTSKRATNGLRPISSVSRQPPSERSFTRRTSRDPPC